MLDQYGRNINYMRISVTDRCNLRCRYCMPEDIPLMQMKDLLTYEEILEIAEAAVSLGITRFKITGGEPLVRRGCHHLIAGLKKIPGCEQVTMTSNGVLLEACLGDLLDAGLDAVNISLDTLDPDRFAEITGRNDLEAVLSGIDAAAGSRLRVKINAVLQQGINDDEWLQIARLAENRNIDVRFIEMMPIGSGAFSRGVSNTELMEKFAGVFPDIQEDHEIHGNGPAVYMHIPGWSGSIGFISAMHGKFCGTCNRIRLSAMGMVKPCLCYEDTVDLREIVRTDADRQTRQTMLKNALSEAVYSKPEQHCFEDLRKITEKQRMVKIGG